MYNGSIRNDSRKGVLSRSASLVKKESLFPLLLLQIYLVLEYCRPQELLPFLRLLRLPAITCFVLGIYIIFFSKFKSKDKQAIGFLFLLCLMVIHGPIAVNNYWALIIFISMASNFIVFIALTRYVDTQEKYIKLLRLWITIHIFLAVIGIVKKGRGIGGFLTDENDFCMTMNMIIPFSFFLAMNASGKVRFYYVALTGLFLFVIILSNSRGGFVGLIAAFIYCWMRTKRKILTAFILGLLAAFAVLVAPPQYWDEIRSIAEEGTQAGTGEERVYTWKIGWRIFLDNPIIGVGQGNFPWVFQKYEMEVTGSDEPFYGRSVAGRAAHSIYFTMLPELGLVGTGIIFGMILYTLKDLNTLKIRLYDKRNKSSNPLSGKYLSITLASEGALVSYLVSGAFISILYYPNLWILMGFIISLRNIVIRDLMPVTA